jgi:hypothetical protein
MKTVKKEKDLRAEKIKGKGVKRKARGRGRFDGV